MIDKFKKKRPDPVDIKTIDMDLLDQLVTKDPSSLPYAHHRGGVPICLDDLDKNKTKALKAMAEQTNEQLSQIYEQMQLLATQAMGIQKRLEVSKMVYQADYKFRPVIGECYYLYEGERGLILSLLSPEEWGGEKMRGKKFISKIKLLADNTWKVVDEDRVGEDRKE